jgi:hypothetical protein
MNSPEFHIGDRVTHKLTGHKMTIRSISESVATLMKDIPEPYLLMGQEMAGDIAICSIENLTKIMEIIHCTVYDDDGNEYKAIVEFEMDSMGDCEVTSVTTSANVPLNNPEIEIKDAIKGRYPKAEITFKTL